MAIIVQTADPQRLLVAIRNAIDQGHIRTWSYDGDGDFTHTPDQWKNQAWLRAVVAPAVLKFGMLGNRNVKISKALYGVFHGRFIEELLTHFDVDMSAVGATPMPLSGVDVIAA